MQFEWDPAKAVTNLRKHQISFDEAIAIFADPNHLLIDTSRFEDGEDRRKVVGRIGIRIFTAVFVMRGMTCRFISARRSNASEERRYDTQNTGS